MTKAKPFDVPKRVVWEAYQPVKANRGAAGVAALGRPRRNDYSYPVAEVEHISAVTFAVRDMARSVAFYRQLGFTMGMSRALLKLSGSLVHDYATISDDSPSPNRASRARRAATSASIS